MFLEAFSSAGHGDVLVVDNGGRADEACVGDLVVLEAQAAGLGGVVVWGLHRDTAEVTQIGLPVFSYGRCPAGPVRLDEQEPSALVRVCFGPSLPNQPVVTAEPKNGRLEAVDSGQTAVTICIRNFGVFPAKDPAFIVQVQGMEFGPDAPDLNAARLDSQRGQ